MKPPEIHLPRVRTAVALALAMLAMLVPAIASSPVSALTIVHPTGPLTSINISPDLNCAVNYAGDAAPEFYGGTACGTFVATDETLYGPASIPAGGNASPRTGFTAVSQTTHGSGTAADPYVIESVADAGTSGLQVRQADSYVGGQETYRTDITVANTSGTDKSAIVYKAADCYLQNSDYGYGAFDPSTGAVSCLAGQAPGARIEQFYPLAQGSSYVESQYGDVWAKVGSQQPFPNECLSCNVSVDNGMGLSWSVPIAAGASVTLSHLTNFSPLGNVPLEVTKTARDPQTAAGGTNAYTISIHNPNISAVTLSSIIDELPATFAYVAGSTSGALTTDPTVSGSHLTWNGPVVVPAGGTATLTFGASVGTVPGTFSNQANATADGVFTVIGTGPTAPVTVVAGNAPPTVNALSANTPQDTPVSVTLTGSDPENDPLTFAVAQTPQHGTVNLVGTQATYTPAAGYSGPDSFTYTANDGHNPSAPATVSITVSPVAANAPPTVNALSATTPQDTPVGVTLTGSDPENDPLTFAVAQTPQHGTVNLVGTQATYTPAAGYSGPDSFTYTANDGHNPSAPATVSITVSPVSSCDAAPTVDATVSKDQKSASAELVSPRLTTSGGGKLLIALISADGPYAPTQKVASVTGGGLTWSLVSRANQTWGTTEVWQAYATSAVSNAKVTARLTKTGFDGSITVSAFSGAAPHVAASASASGISATPKVTVVPTECNSLIWATGHDWSLNKTPVPASGQTLPHLFVDNRVLDTFWTQTVDAPTSGQSVDVSASWVGNDRWTMTAVEIAPDGSAPV